MNPLHDEVKRLHIALAELLKVARIYGDTWVPKSNPSWQVYLARAQAALDGREPAVLEPLRQVCGCWIDDPDCECAR